MLKKCKSYILIDFSKASDDVKACFDDISDLKFFFLRLQALSGIDLYERESVIIFDEVQLFPKARQAIKHLVKDGRYHYIETGSLISIKKNVKDILIPSEEMKIEVFPMDYEEFCDANGISYKILEDIYNARKALGPQVSRKLMRDLRIYMAVRGMPQAVEAYAEGKGAKISPIEVKSSGTGKHESLTAFKKDYSKNVGESFIISQKDIGREEDIRFLPVYLTPFIVK
jgi:predicted AAA+ superfamily ATPase